MVPPKTITSAFLLLKFKKFRAIQAFNIVKTLKEDFRRVCVVLFKRYINLEVICIIVERNAILPKYGAKLKQVEGGPELSPVGHHR